MSFVFPVSPANDVLTTALAVSRKASLACARRDDTIRLIWSKCILGKVAGGTFIKDVIDKDAHTRVFTIDVPESIDTTLVWNNYKHIAMYQNLGSLCNNHVKTVPWQIRVEFCHAVRPYLWMKDELIEEIDLYMQRFGWKFITTDEGFLLTPLYIFNEVKSYSELFGKWTSAMRTLRGPGYTDVGWGDDDFKNIIDLDDVTNDALHESAALANARSIPLRFDARIAGSNAAAASSMAGAGRPGTPTPPDIETM